MSFSNHSRINFVDYFKLFGSVDNVCCFSSECYLGLVTHGFYDCNNRVSFVIVEFALIFVLFYFYSGCQIIIYNNADLTVFVNNFIAKVVNAKFYN